MKRPSAALWLALILGAACGAVLAQEEGESAPSVLDAGSTAPDEGDAPDSGVPDADRPEAATPDDSRSVLMEKKGDVLEMPPAPVEPAPPRSLPQHGMKMREVEAQFGPPVARQPAVGNPPITRWDYDGFSVFFEHSTVLHAVQEGRPAEIYRREELLPATTP